MPFGIFPCCCTCGCASSFLARSGNTAAAALLAISASSFVVDYANLRLMVSLRPWLRRSRYRCGLRPSTPASVHSQVLLDPYPLHSRGRTSVARQPLPADSWLVALAVLAP